MTKEQEEYRNRLTDFVSRLEAQHDPPERIAVVVFWKLASREQLRDPEADRGEAIPCLVSQALAFHDSERAAGHVMTVAGGAIICDAEISTYESPISSAITEYQRLILRSIVQIGVEYFQSEALGSHIETCHDVAEVMEGVRLKA
jgi:hypothetical protein